MPPNFNQNNLSARSSLNNDPAQRPLNPVMVPQPMPTPAQMQNSEPSKNHKNKILLFVIGILVLIVLGLVTYIVIDKTTSGNVSSSSTASDSNEPSNPISSESSGTAAPETTDSAINVLNFYPDSTAVLYKKEVYVNIDDSTPIIDDLYGEGAYQNLIATRANYQTFEFGDSTVTINHAPFSGQKLDATGVVAVFDYRAGHALDVNYGLILLKEDKTLSIISLKSLINGKTAVTPITSLTDIADVASRDEMGIATYAITSSGTEVNLAEYIPVNPDEF